MPPKAPISTADWRANAEQIAASLPPDQQSAALQTLLIALRLAHGSALGAACRATWDLLKACTWLRAELSARLDLPELERSLKNVLRAGNFPEDRTWGRTEVFWATRTLRAVKESGIVDLVPLGGLFLVALLDFDRAAPSHPPRSAIEKFGQLIRGIADRRSRHPHRADISGLAQANSLLDCATRFGKNLLSPEIRSHFATCWERQWLPWINSLSRIPVGSLAQDALHRDETAHRRRTFRIPMPALDSVEDPENVPEPQDEAATWAEIGRSDPIPATIPLPDRAEQRTYFVQAIRQRNTELLPGHIDVLSQAELRQILPCVNQAFEQALGRQDVMTAAAVVVYQLILVTGRDLNRVLNLPIVRCAGPGPPTDLELDPDRGTIRQPIIQPQFAHNSVALRTVKIPMRGLVPTQPWFSLPLPPSLTDRLRRLLQIHPVARVQDWLGDAATAFNSTKTLLHSIAGLPEISTSLARARRWISAHLIESSGDLAATMLVCGDYFGRATTPLFYYAPTISHLQSLYRSTTWTVFDDDPKARHQNEDRGNVARTGAGLLFEPDCVQAGLSELRDQLHRAIPRHWTADRMIEHHNLLTAYVLLYFCIITSHRPTRALLELRWDDLDPGLRLAIVSDKKVDAAHLHRPAALSSGLAQQLQYYYDHLGRIDERKLAQSPIRKAVRDASSSRGAFFFFLDRQSQPLRGVKPWLALWPQAWRDWPANWYRHFQATFLRECGAPASLVLAQMGHLEAAGFPFSSTSLLSPAEFARRLQTPLDAFERLCGLAPEKGALRSRPSVSSIPPLRTWKKPLDTLARKTRQIELTRRLQIRAQTREHREAGLRAALGVLDTIAPAVAARIRSESIDPGTRHKNRRHRTDPCVELAFDEKQAIGLVEALDRLPLSPIVRNAAHREIGRALRRLRRREGLPLADVGSTFSAPPAEPTSLFPGALLAVRQVRALREGFLADSPRLRAQDPDLHLALVLILHGGVSDWPELQASLSGAARAELVGIAGPSLLVPLGQNAAGAPASGFSGTAALALAGSGGGNRAPPVYDSISTSLRRWCQQRLWKTMPADPLRALLQTVAIAHRIEQSGLARHSASADGCACGSYSLQRALLADTLVSRGQHDRTRTLRIAPSEAPTGGPPSISGEDQSLPSAPSTTAKLRARRYLRRIAQTWHRPAQPNVSRRVTLQQVRKRLNRLTASIDPHRRLLVEEALALFALNLATVGTPKRDEPATATLATYLTAVGRDLADRLAGIDLNELTADDLQTVYLQIVESKALHAAPRTARRAAEQLYQFHKYLATRLGFEPITASEFGQYLSESRRSVDADSITTAEYRAARAWLSNAIEANTPLLAGTRHRRECFMVRLVLDLLYASGARISEVVFLRFSDIFIGGDDVVLFIRPTLYRRLKTAAGRRRIDLSRRLLPEAIEDLRAWLEAERLRRGAGLRPSDLLFPELDSSRRSPGVAWFRSRIAEAFAKGAGRRCWPHLMRHHRVFREVRSVLEEQGARETEVFVKTRMLRSVATELGHAAITTSFSCYFHFPWLMRSMECKHLAPAPNRHALAALSGLTLGYVDKLGQRPPPRRRAEHLGRPDLELTRVERILLRRAPLATPAPVPIQSADRPEAGNTVPDFGVRALDALLRAIKTPDAVYRIRIAWGLSLQEADRIQWAVTQLALQTKYRLLQEVSVEGKARRLRIARQFRQLNVRSWAERLDTASETARAELARLFERCYRVRAALRKQCFVGKAEEINELHNLLSSLGGLNLTKSRLPRSNLLLAGFPRVGTTKSPFQFLCRILALNAARERVLRGPHSDEVVRGH